MRMTRHVEPCGFFEPHIVDNESVTFPFADGISEPRRVGILRQRASVCEYLAVKMISLEQQNDKTRLLNDLPRRDVTVGIGHAVGDTMAVRPILAVVLLAFLVNLLRPGLHLNFNAVRGEIL